MSDNQCGVYAALSKAQSKFKEIKKTKTGQIGNLQYKYAVLADVLKATQPALNEHDLAVTQVLGFVDTKYGLITSIHHKDGSSVDSFYTLPDAASKNPQEFGKILTYARRYSYAALIGIESEEDTDGAGKADKSKPQTKTNQQKKPEVVNHAPNAIISDGQRKRLFAIMNEHSWDQVTLKKLLFKMTKSDSTKTLNQKHYKQVCDFMEKHDPMDVDEMGAVK